MYKVVYTYPDKSNCGNDRFESYREAYRYCQSLIKSGYNDVVLIQTDGLYYG